MADRISVPLLGAILLEQGKVRPEMLDHALQVQRTSSRTVRLGEVLVQLGYIAEQDLLEALRAQRTMAEEVAQLLSPPEERPTILLVSASEALEMGLRAALPWSLHNLVRVDARVAAEWGREGNVRALLWEIDEAEETALKLLPDWRRACPDLPLVILVHEACPARTIERALQVGADQVLVLPTQERWLIWALHRAMSRQRLQDQLKAQRTRLNRMEQVLAFSDVLGRLLSDTPDGDTLMLGVAGGIASLLEAEACLVQWAGENSFISGPHAGYIDGDLPEGLQQALDHCHEQPEPLALDDVRQHPVWGNLPFDLPGLVVHTLLCVPLCAGRQGLGAIAAINRLDGIPFSPEDRQIFAAVARQVALVLENVRLRNGAAAVASMPLLHRAVRSA